MNPRSRPAGRRPDTLRRDLSLRMVQALRQLAERQPAPMHRWARVAVGRNGHEFVHNAFRSVLIRGLIEEAASPPGRMTTYRLSAAGRRVLEEYRDA